MQPVNSSSCTQRGIPRSTHRSVSVHALRVPHSGDTLAVLPRTPSATVDALLQRLGLDGAQRVCVQPSDDSSQANGAHSQPVTACGTVRALIHVRACAYVCVVLDMFVCVCALDTCIRAWTQHKKRHNSCLKFSCLLSLFIRVHWTLLVLPQGATSSR